MINLVMKGNYLDEYIDLKMQKELKTDEKQGSIIPIYFFFSSYSFFCYFRTCKFP